jgi:hypothetical protein
MMHSEKNDPYQGIALAMQQKGVEVVTGLGRRDMARQRLKPGVKCVTEWHA